MIPTESNRGRVTKLEKRDECNCDVPSAVHHCGDPYKADSSADCRRLNGAANEDSAAAGGYREETNTERDGEDAMHIILRRS